MKRSPTFARRLAALLLVAGAFVSANARAHEFWLSPSRYRAMAGDTIEVSAHIGTGFRGDLKPYAASRVVRFSLRHARSIDAYRALLARLNERRRHGDECRSTAGGRRHHAHSDTEALRQPTDDREPERS